MAPVIPSFITEFFHNQLVEWDIARDNFSFLKRNLRKPFTLGRLEGFVQFNPARKVSTTARVDTKSINERKCFLCSANRPAEQRELEILPGWQLLVNPFPILDYHFTISGKNHLPQKFDLSIAFQLASLLPGMIIFFNDDGAGASAPDHIHFQAVGNGQLPLMNLIDKFGSHLLHSEPQDISRVLDVPYCILAGEVINSDSIFKETSLSLGKELDNLPKNYFFWMTSDNKLRYAIIPRRAHRPDCYFAEPPMRRAFSPGAIDMAGILVTPFEEDFKAVDEDDILQIYSQVGLPNG